MFRDCPGHLTSSTGIQTLAQGDNSALHMAAWCKQRAAPLNMAAGREEVVGDDDTYQLNLEQLESPWVSRAHLTPSGPSPAETMQALGWMQRLCWALPPLSSSFS
uniref:Uncharacterized protein n=1 Tax=Athene cunicularia TaxID=194338 RepID=A0A663N9C9_ATHCN